MFSATAISDKNDSMRPIDRGHVSRLQWILVAILLFLYQLAASGWTQVWNVENRMIETYKT